MTKYLDNNGLAYFWQKVKAYVDAHSGGGSKSTFYGTCSTTASTTAKVVTCSGFTLTAGNIIGIYFSTANTAATPTLNVNSTGAKSIRIGNTAPSSTTNVLKWSAAAMVYFMYDGTYYRYLGMQQVASNVQGGNTWYGTCSTAAGTTAKTSAITNYKLTAGAIVVLNCSTANTVAAPTLNVNSTGAKTINGYYNEDLDDSDYQPAYWNANDVLTLVYTGSAYLIVSKQSNSTAADFVVEQGTSGNWFYRKWNSGIAECWGNFTHYTTITDKYGNGWYSSGFSETFPDGLFIEAPNACILSPVSTNYGFSLEIGSGLSATQTPSFWLFRVEGGTSTSFNATVHVDAKGRWK